MCVCACVEMDRRGKMNREEAKTGAASSELRVRCSEEKMATCLVLSAETEALSIGPQRGKKFHRKLCAVRSKPLLLQLQSELCHTDMATEDAQLPR